MRLLTQQFSLVHENKADKMSQRWSVHQAASSVRSEAFGLGCSWDVFIPLT